MGEQASDVEPAGNFTRLAIDLEQDGLAHRSSRGSHRAFIGLRAPDRAASASGDNGAVLVPRLRALE